MNKLYADSISKAKAYYENFGDILHNLAHSERVARNAREIGQQQGYKDLDFLELCAYWHDTARTQNKEPHEEAGAIMARDDLLSRESGDELANRAYEAIRFHQSTANPTTIEGKIVRDADKLDIFSVERWEACVDAGWAKEYADDFAKTIENLSRYPEVFTYDHAKKLYEKQLPKFLEFSKSIERAPKFDRISDRHFS